MPLLLMRTASRSNEGAAEMKRYVIASAIALAVVAAVAAVVAYKITGKNRKTALI